MGDNKPVKNYRNNIRIINLSNFSLLHVSANLTDLAECTDKCEQI